MEIVVDASCRSVSMSHSVLITYRQGGNHDVKGLDFRYGWQKMGSRNLVPRFFTVPAEILVGVFNI